MFEANSTTALATLLLAGLFALGGQSSQAQESVDITGKWEWTLDLGTKSGKITMDVTQKGKQLSAVLTTPDGEKIKPKEFVVKDGKVKILIERKRGLFKFKMTHIGELKGDQIRGEFSAAGGPIKKSGKWQAKRVKEKNR